MRFCDSTPSRRAFAVLAVFALVLAGCAREPEPPATEMMPAGGRLLSSIPFSGRPFTLADTGPEMLPVAAGAFQMGSPDGEAGRTRAEGPQTAVTISRPFWLGRTTVTHGQWKTVMGTDLAAQAQKAFGGDTAIARALAGADDAVAMHLVNWRDAMAFCEKLNARARAEGTLPAGYEFTLPTEAQWEYACRAGTSDPTYAGPVLVLDDGSAPVLDVIAWHAGNSALGYQGPDWNAALPGKHPVGGRAGPHAAGLKEANAWGFCDMLGNVYQWCRDFSAGALPGGSVTDPAGPKSGSDRIVRGGSWHSEPACCRSAYRAWNTPDGRTQFIGFRLALAPKLSR